MEMFLYCVLTLTYALVTLCGDHVVKSNQFYDQQMKKCHDRNGDCWTERLKGKKTDFLLGLPRIDAVKVCYF